MSAGNLITFNNFKEDGLVLEYSLNDKQKQLLEKYGEDYTKWIETSDGIETIQEHRTHESYFKQELSPEKLDSMSEQEFAEIYKKL